MTKEKQETVNLGLFGKIAHYFIHNSKLSILLIISIVVWGVVSFVFTPKQYDPEITAPSFQVKLIAPSAESEEFYDRITKIFEDELLDINGVEDVISQTQEGGSADITVNFFVGENEEESNIKIRQRVDEVRNKVPDVVNKVERITISERDPDDIAVYTLALTSEEKDLLTLRELAIDYQEILKKTDQVTNVEIHGGDRRELRITLDEEKLAEYQLDPRIVLGKVRQHSYRIFVSDEFEENGQRKVVEVNGLFENPEEAKGMVISKTNGVPVKLGDLGEVEYVAEEKDSYIRFKDQANTEKQVVYLSLAKEDGANITVVTDSIKEKIKTLEVPENVQIVEVRNDGEIAREEINELVFNLLLAVVIVAVILLFFLGWRPALVAALAIPLSISSVFGVALITGQTINRITLFALILSLGLLIDNATVIVENAVRHLNQRKSSRKLAVAKAVDEVGVGLFLATLTTVVAFLPMMFVTGMMGPYMGPIPFFVPVALIASLAIAYTLNPYLSSVFLKPKNDNQEKTEDSKFFKKYRELLNTIFTNKSLRRLVLVGAVIVTLIVLTLPTFQAVKFRMLPKDNKEKFYVYLDYSDKTTLGNNLENTKEIEDIILTQNEVDNLQSFVAGGPIADFNGMFRGVEGRVADNQATIKVNLTDSSARSQSSEEIAENLRKVLLRETSEYEDLRLTVVEDAPGPPVRSTAMVKIKGIDRENINQEEREKIKQITKDFEDIFEQTEGIVDVDSDLREPVETVSLQVKLEEASNRGLMTKDIIDNLDIALEGRPVTLYRDTVDKERERIFLTMEEELEKDLERLRNMQINYVPTIKEQLDGETVKVKADRQIALKEVVEIERVTRDNVLFSQNKDLTYSVKGEMEGRSVTYAAVDVLIKMYEYKLPWTDNSELIKINMFEAEYEDKDTGFRYVVKWDGEWELTLEVFRDLGLAMLVAVFLIYAILVAQFKSFKVPLLILGTVPLALIGVLPGYAILGLINGMYFNATSMIGVIALAGIVVNNAIIMVEYIKQLETQGNNLKSSVIEAAATRLRPITLTALTTIFGSLTLVTDPVWAGLGWSIVLGMTASTILTLTVFPVSYYTFMQKPQNNDD